VNVEKVPTFRIAELSHDRPAFGQILIASELRKLGFSISPAGVRSIEARSSLL
jgi:hypothetical protein